MRSSQWSVIKISRLITLSTCKSFDESLWLSKPYCLSFVQFGWNSNVSHKASGTMCCSNFLTVWHIKHVYTKYKHENSLALSQMQSIFRKSYMTVRLVPKSVTLNDFERRNGPYCVMALILRYFADFGSFCILKYVYDVVVKSSRSLSHLLTSFLFVTRAAASEYFLKSSTLPSS